MTATTAHTWRERAELVEIPRQAFIDGEFADPASGETFKCVSPIDGRALGEVASCGAADVDRAVAGARAAFDSGVWSQRAPKERKRGLLRLAEIIDTASRPVGAISS